MTRVRFLIIGAQKAGTTSLFEYMRRHPEIHMPPEKEVAFFAADRLYRRGLDWYEARVTRNAPAGAVCGSASVGDMTGTPFRDISFERWDPDRLRGDSESLLCEQIEDVIPRRIKGALPDARLLCVLRDPVERAFSHYRMAVLDGLESRPFDAAIAQLLEPRVMQHAREVATGHNGYIARGEYGRILSGFLRTFPREQLMVVFSSELERDPCGTLTSIFDFVGVGSRFVPDNLGKRYRAAAVRQRVPWFDLNRCQASLARLRAVRALWHRLPPRVRGAVGRSASIAAYRVELWNAWRDQQEGEEMSAFARQMLRGHFLEDGEVLSEMLGREVPWLAEWDTRAVPAHA